MYFFFSSCLQYFHFVFGVLQFKSDITRFKKNSKVYLFCYFNVVLLSVVWYLSLILKKSLVIFFKNYLFCPVFCFIFFWDSNYIHIRPGDILPQLFDSLFSFTHHFLHSVWVSAVAIDIYLHSQIISLAMFGVLMNLP